MPVEASPQDPAGSGARSALLGTYRRAREYIDRELVRLVPRRHDPEGKLATVRRFNAALGDPQRAYPAIQVAGTSGKGSVAALIADALAAAGQRVGRHVSPYLQAFTEKTWIDGRYLDAAGLGTAVDAVRPVADPFRREPDGPASVHGMASLAVSYLAFRRAGVAMAVMETGVGGRYDLVQGLDRALGVITDLGLDHVVALGSTIEEIAWHKAGIMERGVPCVAVRGAGWPVLEREAAAVGAELIAVEPAAVTRARDGRRLELALPRLGRVEVELATDAPFAGRNAALAARALDALAERGWPLAAEHLARGFAGRPLPGRAERLPGEPPVLLDGAHNPQKMAALLSGMAARERLVVLYGATGQRAQAEILSLLRPHARSLVACSPSGLYGKETVPAARLAAAARQAGIPARAAASPAAGLEAALAEAAEAGVGVLITGSIYLAGEVRNHWYPWQEVVLQRTSWPRLPEDVRNGGGT